MENNQLPHARTYRPRGQRMYEGESLRTVAFPLGGIGTGTVSLGGRGQLTDWEIFNHPSKGAVLPFTFFALWLRPDGGQSTAHVLERRFLPPYATAHGLPPGTQSGLPRFRDARFFGEYPFAWLDLSDPDVPLALRLRAWNPMVPLDADSSGLPVALLDWHVVNTTPTPVDLSIAFSVLNPVGWDGLVPFGGRRAGFLGGNRNEERHDPEAGLRGVRMASDRLDRADPAWGTVAVASPWEHVDVRPWWRRGAWFDDLQAFWDDFRADGRLDAAGDPGTSPDGETDVASVVASARLEPGEAADIPFTLAWSFPNLRNTWNTEEPVRGKRLGNLYAVRFPDAWDAARYVATERERLERETSAFHDALFGGTLPDVVTDAASANMSIVRSTTCLQTEDGRLHAFEGCNDGSGCCPMNCTHVWNYAQSVAHLYPALERTVRETDFAHNTKPAGWMSFRTLLPLIGETIVFHAAADGQMGSIVRLYREWRTSGDTEWLRGLWPRAKASLEYAWSPHNADGWDGDHDGVMEGIQHNTYDIEFVGPNIMMGAWYLAALRAAAEMAEALGEADAASQYRALAERGAAGYEALWNGEYYEQHVRFASDQTPLLTPHGGDTPVDGAVPRYQYGPGCLADQMVGQWAAHCVGLGYVLPEDRVKSAVASVARHNAWADLSSHESCQRVYALNDEGGVLLCTWPRGGRPEFPFPYADEVWPGIEYQVAAHLIWEGFVDDGLAIAQRTRDRFAGHNRNPWDECECGHHYARSLASWSLLQAWTGFQYNAVRRSIGFRPCVEGDLRAFFIAGAGWGVYERAGTRQALRLMSGTLSLARWENASGALTLDGAPVAAREEAGGLALNAPARLSAGSVLSVG